MNKTVWGSLLAVVLLASMLALGCPGQQGGDRPSTSPVSGTVTYDGQPVDGATVAFQSADGSRSAVGVTDAGGKYTLTTFESGDGAVPGEYQVKIFKYEVEATEGPGGEIDMDSPEYVPPEIAGEGATEDSGEPENLLPEKYNDPTTSGLTATVSEGENTLDFPLED